MLEHQAAYVDHLLDVVATEQRRPGGRRGRRLRPRTPPRRRRPARRRGARPAGRLARPRGAHLGQPRLRPAPRLRLPAHRRGRCPSPHRRVVGRHAGAPGGRPRAGRRPRHPLPRPAGAARAVAAPRAHATRLRSPRRCDACAPTSPRDRLRSVVLAHAFVAGGLPSDSERDISVGGVSVVSSDAVRRASPTPRSVTCTDAPCSATTLRYSGSPLAYSFSEAGPHQGQLAGRPGARRRDRHDLRRGTGAAAAARCSPATSRPCSPTRRSRRAETHWVQATLTDAVRPDRPDGAAPDPLPPRPRAVLRARRRAGPQRRGRSPRGAAPTTRWRSTSWPSPCGGRRPPPTSRRCCSVPATRVPRTPTSTCWSRLPRVTADAPPPALGHRLRALRRHRGGRLRRSSPTPGCSCCPGPPAPGKSSVLDAVCFALYGAVPGDRRTPAVCAPTRRRCGWHPRCRSRSALSGRRFRVVRSPAWDRPKKRGTGTTREQARGDAQRAGGRRVGPPDQPARRGRRPGLGPARDEPRPVLPGGDAAAGTLPGVPAGEARRATAAPGAALPHRPVRAGRGAGCATIGSPSGVGPRPRRRPWRDLVSRLSEVAHTAVPTDCADLASAADDALPTWVETVRADAASRRTTTAAEADDAAAAHDTAAAALACARELATSRTRVVTAAETIERLDLESEHHAAQAARLERARRAEGVRPLARLVDQRAQACAEAQRRAEASREQARRAEIDVDELPAALDRLADDLAAVTTLLPAEQLLDDLRRQQAAIHAELDQLAAEDELASAEATSLAALQARAGRGGPGARTRPRPRCPAREAELERLGAIAGAHDDARPADRRARDGDRPSMPPPVPPWSTCVRCCSTSANAGSPGWPPSSPVGWSSVATARSAVPTTTRIRPSARPHIPTPTPSARLSERSTTHRPSSWPSSSGCATSRPHSRRLARRRGWRPPRSSAPSSPRPGAPSTRLRGRESAGIAVRPRIAEASGRASELAAAASARQVRTAELDTTREHLRARVVGARGAGRVGAGRASRAARGGRVAHRPP